MAETKGMTRCRRKRDRDATAPIVLWLVLLSPVAAQEPKDPAVRWKEAIENFETQDREHPPADGQVLFVGSSSIRLWKLDEGFPDVRSINRGFGGSEISDVNFFLDRIVLKYKPRLIFFYAGDNDVAKGKSADQVVKDYQTFLRRVNDKLPETHVVFLPIKPSVARWELWPVMSEANQRIEKICHENSHWHYADTASVLLNNEGVPDKQYFLDDGLHLNPTGYKRWEKVVRPLLSLGRTK